jgi:ribosome-binding protein aMBF1 (putative translation factor)
MFRSDSPPGAGICKKWLLLLIYSLITQVMERINRIKEVLVIKGMQQKELAQKLGKSANTITSICNNKTQPHLKDLKKIAKILDVDIRELLVPTK